MFDFAAPAPKTAPRAAAVPTIVSVSRLSQYLKKLITSDPSLKELSVRGEVTGFRPLSSTSRHLYFSLKDENAVIACVVWSDEVKMMPPLRDGTRIVVHGAIDLYPKSGRYQLRIKAAELDGDGAVYLALEELRTRLQAEGIFAVERKRPLPRFPFAIALVSSATAAGANDFRRICARRSPHVRVTLIETPVQGDGAAERIALAIMAAGRGPFDAIAVVRGGGAAEDLWAFQAEAVVRAIVASPLPVFTGIGHESDVTLADHAADLRAATPTDAATRLPALDDVYQELDRVVTALRNRTQQHMGRRRERLAGLMGRLERRSPRAQLTARRQKFIALQVRLGGAAAVSAAKRRDRLSRALERLNRASTTVAARLRVRLTLLQAKLHGRNPEAILELGYAIVRSEGRALTGREQLEVGARIEARLAHGTLLARVEALSNDGTEARQPV